MKVTVHHAVTINVEGEKPWKVPLDLLKTIDGTDFLKIMTTNPGVVRIVLGNSLSKSIGSLARSKGLAELKNLRNQKQRDMFNDAHESSSKGAASLFGEGAVDEEQPAAAPKVRYSRLLSQGTSAHLRKNLEVIELDVPMPSGETANIAVARPGHPDDNIIVKLDAESLEVLIRMVRDSEFGDTRAYQKDRGSWKMGNRRFAKKIGVQQKSPSSKKRRFVYDRKVEADKAKKNSTDNDEEHDEEEDVVDEGEEEDLMRLSDLEKESEPELADDVH